jgi:hypothetical protein
MELTADPNEEAGLKSAIGGSFSAAWRVPEQRRPDRAKRLGRSSTLGIICACLRVEPDGAAVSLFEASA